MKQGLDLSIYRQEEDIIWEGVSVNVLMYENLIAESDRMKQKPKKVHDRKLKEIA